MHVRGVVALNLHVDKQSRCLATLDDISKPDTAIRAFSFLASQLNSLEFGACRPLCHRRSLCVDGAGGGCSCLLSNTHVIHDGRGNNNYVHPTFLGYIEIVQAGKVESTYSRVENYMQKCCV
jgi:hypothetical protein